MQELSIRTPREFLNAVQSGIDAHIALIEYGRGRAAAMQAIRIEEAQKRAEERQRTELIEISELPTMLIQSVKLPEEEVEQLVEESPNMYSQKVEAARPDMPVDAACRPYLAINNPYEDTVDLAESLVIKYRMLRGEYPSAIIVSFARFIMLRDAHFVVGNTRIPYIHEADIMYDVAVRGKQWMQPPTSS